MILKPRLFFLGRSKTNQDSTGKWPYLNQRAYLALVELMKELSERQEYLMVGITRGGEFHAIVWAQVKSIASTNELPEMRGLMN